MTDSEIRKELGSYVQAAIESYIARLNSMERPTEQEEMIESFLKFLM